MTEINGIKSKINDIDVDIRDFDLKLDMCKSEYSFSNKIVGLMVVCFSFLAILITIFTFIP